MKSRFILYRRQRGGMFYIEDTHTRKQESLGTKIRAEAAALLNARNESIRQPQLNLQIAKAYLAGTDSGVSTRTWRDAFNAIIENKTASTKERWQRGARQKAFDLIHPLIIVETQAEHLFACLKAGTVSTNILLRELHNFCISMNWLAWPIIPKRLWPKIEYGPKRAITADEHRMIVERERNLECGRFMSFAGTWAVHKPTSPIWRLKTLTGPTALLLMPAEKPEVRRLFISVRRLKRSCTRFRAGDSCCPRSP
jgi:hypothetical protein